MKSIFLFATMLLFAVFTPLASATPIDNTTQNIQYSNAIPAAVTADITSVAFDASLVDRTPVSRNHITYVLEMKTACTGLPGTLGGVLYCTG